MSNNKENIEQEKVNKNNFFKKLCSFALLFLFISIICYGCSNSKSNKTDILGKGKWIVVTDRMDKPRSPATANLLPDGNVLIMGGLDVNADTAEIFDPNQMKIIKSIPLDDGRFYDYSATSLLNGDVFIAGGYLYENRKNPDSTNKYQTKKVLYLTDTTKIFDSKTYEFKDTKNMKYKMGDGNCAQLLSNGNVLIFNNIIGTDAIDREKMRFQIYDSNKNDYYEVQNMIHRIFVGKHFLHLNNGDILFDCYVRLPNDDEKGGSSWCLYNVKDNKFEKYSDDIPSGWLFIQLDSENYLSISPATEYSIGFTYNIKTKEKIPVKNHIPKTWGAGMRPQMVLLNNGNVLILNISLKNSSDKYRHKHWNYKYSAYIYDREKNKFYEVPAPPYPVFNAAIIKLKNGDILVAGGGYREKNRAKYSDKIQIYKYKH